jgi:hypothetical protein
MIGGNGALGCVEIVSLKSSRSAQREEYGGATS